MKNKLLKYLILIEPEKAILLLENRDKNRILKSVNKSSNKDFVKHIINTCIDVYIKESGFFITFEKIISKGRNRNEIVFPRQIIEYFLRKETKLSLKAISWITSKNHATILHSKKTIENLIETDKKVKKLIDKIQFRIINVKIDNNTIDCPVCRTKMKGVKQIHYHCYNCDENFTD